MLHCVTHWPFCPGVFIAILAFVAAAVMFRKDPGPREKAIWVFVFLFLMVGEIWMMSKDRNAHDSAERDAQTVESGQSNMLGILILQNAETFKQMDVFNRKLDAAKGNPQQLAAIRAQMGVLQKKSDLSSKQLLLALAPAIANELESLGDRWSATQQQSVARGANNTVAAIRSQGFQQAYPSLVKADFVRQQLLQDLPPTALTPDDISSAAAFAKSIAKQSTFDDLKMEAQYLRELASRVAATSTDP